MFQRSQDALLFEARLDYDAQFLEQRCEIHRRRLVRGIAQFHARDFFERHDQVAERFEVLAAIEFAAARQVGVRHRDGAADVADLVRNRSHQDPRSGEQLIQDQFFRLRRSSDVSTTMAASRGPALVR